MVGTFFDYKAPTPEQANPWNSVLSKALEQYQGITKAKYARPQAEADIFAKKFGPLAQIATSPLAQYMLPEQRQQIIGQLSQLLSQNSGMGVGGNNNENGQEHQGLLSHIAQALHLQSNPQIQQHMDPEQDEKTLGATADIAGTIGGRTIQGMTKEQVAPGTVYGTTRDTRISPSSGMREQTQNAIIGGKNTQDMASGLMKQLDSLKDDNSFLGQIQKASLGLEGTNIPYVTAAASALVPRDLENFENKLTDSLIANHNYSKETAYKVAHKGLNESITHYRNRLIKELRELNKKEQRLTDYTKEGVPLENKESPNAEFFFTLPSGESGFMPATNLEAFKKAYPKAKID